MILPSALSSQPRSALANSRRSEKSSFSYHSAFFSAVIAVASSISPGWGESLKMSVIKFRLFSSVLPAACAVRDAPQANAATAEVERKFRHLHGGLPPLYLGLFYTDRGRLPAAHGIPVGLIDTQEEMEFSLSDEKPVLRVFRHRMGSGDIHRTVCISIQDRPLA